MTNHVANHQHHRIREATIETAAQFSLATLSVQQIIARAGVSRATFYKLYSGKEDAFHVAINGVVREIRERVSGQPDPLTVLVAYACSEVEAARCLLVELPAVAPESYEDYLEGVVEDVAQATGLEQVVAHMLVGAVTGILRNTVSYGRLVNLTELEAFVRSFLDDAAVPA